MKWRVRVRVVPDGGGWRILVHVGRRQFGSETIFARARDAHKAAAAVAQATGGVYTPPRRPL